MEDEVKTGVFSTALAVICTYVDLLKLNEISSRYLAQRINVCLFDTGPHQKHVLAYISAMSIVVRYLLKYRTGKRHRWMKVA